MGKYIACICEGSAERAILDLLFVMKVSIRIMKRKSERTQS